MDGSIVVLSIRYLQRSMAEKNIRQMAYDECPYRPGEIQSISERNTVS